MTMRPSWDAYFADITQAVRARADCRRRRVGCVIVDTDHRIVATGYNGSPPGGPSCLAGECPRGMLSYAEQAPGGDYSNCVAIHAEDNALRFARESVVGATVYLTDEPCDGCSELMREAGIARVVLV